MSKVKLALVYLGIFLGFLSLGYLLFTFLIKPKLAPVQKQNSVVGTGRTASPPANYKRPSILPRLDFSKIAPDPAITPKPNKPFKPEYMFNTVDDAGNFFLFGVFKTASGKMLVAGIIQRIEINDNLSLWLEDGVGDTLPVYTRLPLKEGKWVKVASRNNPKLLDLREKLTITDRDINTFKDSLVGSRVALEVEPDSEVIKCLTSSCPQSDLLLVGKVLYYE